MASLLVAMSVSIGAAARAQDSDHGGQPQPTKPLMLPDRPELGAGQKHGAPLADEVPPEAPASRSLPDADERRLEDEQRLLDGRIQSLDRQLAPYDRDRLRAPPRDPLTGQRRSRQDPIAERHSRERRALESQQRSIEQDLGSERYDRGPSLRPSFGRDR